MVFNLAQQIVCLGQRTYLDPEHKIINLMACIVVIGIEILERFSIPLTHIQVFGMQRFRR